MPLEVEGGALEVDDEGYLVDPAQWGEQACKTAGMRRPRAWSTG